MPKPEAPSQQHPDSPEPPRSEGADQLDQLLASSHVTAVRAVRDALHGSRLEAGPAPKAEQSEVASAEQSRRRSLLGEAAREQAELTRSVFVVYGRDDAANSAVFQLLRRLDLKPLEWESLVRGSKGGMTPMLSDVVINAPLLASGAVVVLTPDDMVMLHPELRKPREDPFEQHPSLQPRPNVLLELGLVLGVYPERTLILEFGERRPIADLDGLNSIRFHQHTDYVDALRKIAGRLQEAGLPVDDAGSDWLDPRPFENLTAYGRRPN